MTLPVFTPPLAPDADLGKDTTPRVLMSGLGDGYTHRVADGPNTLLSTWAPTWSVLTIAQANTIENFFIAQAGIFAFTWTPPGDTVARVIICPKWNRVTVDGANAKITATFNETVDFGSS